MDRPTAPSTPARRVLGTLLVLAGVVALVLGAWGLHDDVLAASPTRSTARVWAALLLVALALWTALRVLDARRARDGWSNLPDAGWLAFGAVAVLGLVVAGCGVHGLRGQARAGFAGPVSLLLGAGGIAILVGTGLAAGAPRRGGWRAPPRAVAAAAALVTVMAAAVGILAGSAPRWGLHTSPARAAAVPPTPAIVSGPVWSTALEGRVRAVVPAGAGVVAALNDRVVALDGRTGRRRWSYGRAHAMPGELTASPDGRWVAFTLAPDDHGDVDVVVLDAQTGRVRATLRDPSAYLAPGFETVELTAHGLIAADDDDRRFRARSFSGAALWQHAVPAGCDAGHDEAAAPAGLVEIVRCPPPAGTTAELIDAATGAVRWRFALPATARGKELDTLVSYTPDHRIVGLEWSADGFAGDVRGAVLDTASGRRLPADPRATFVGSAFGSLTSGPGLRNLRSGVVVTRTPEAAPCARDQNGSALIGGAICWALAPHRDVGGYAATGRLSISAIPLVGATHAFTLDLGRPAELVDQAVCFTAAPGAVVAWSPQVPRSGRAVLIGLR